MEEVRQTKNYLKKQILMMQENAKPVAFSQENFNLYTWDILQV